MIDSELLERSGYTPVHFERRKWLDEIKDLVNSHFPCDPTLWHEQKDVSQSEHLHLAHQINAVIQQGDYVKKLVLDNLQPFRELLGPNLDVQTSPHLRISRPEKEEDLLNWHRDYFYGNSPWEMNLWFPVFPLEAGANLLFVEGSHIAPARNIQVTQDTNEFRSSVTKGSIAHDLGYVYLPKTDDTIVHMKPEQVKHLSPELGSAILFFGCGIHRARNLSNRTRITLDIRIRDARAPNSAKPGYYSPLCRGVVERCVSRFLENTPSDTSS